MPNIFISYDYKDKAWVEEFVEKLEQNPNPNLNLHIDTRFVQYGDNFINWIDTCLRTADIIMPIISNNYVKNISFARLEYQEMILRSIKSQKRIIPVFMEKVDIEDLPIGISSIRSYYAYVEDNPIADLIQSITSKQPNTSFIARIDFIPSNRRIRVQVTSACNQNCDWCNSDEFDKKPGNALPERTVRNLISHFDNFHGAPRPRLEFVFTGGEPLIYPNLFFNFVQEIPCNILEKSFLLTNGHNLDDTTQTRLRDLRLLNIRITFSNLLEEPYCDRIDPLEPINTHFQNIVNNIRRISNDPIFKIRINHTLITDNQEQEIHDMLSYVNHNFPMIRHIAFLQIDQSNEDIFKVGETWAEQELAARQEITSPRIRQYRHKKATIDFVKMNCHLFEKNRLRCLLCVLDKDILLTSDGRIRLCCDWKKVNKPTFQDLHLDDENPWQGISTAIRTQWATAGFYRHFEELVTLNETNDNNPILLNEYGNRIETALESQILYEEKFQDQNEAMEVIELCGRFLDDAFRQFQINDMSIREKLAANINLLVLIHLCVDETLFSTGRASMVCGLASRILRHIKDNFHRILNDDHQLSQLLEVTTYCIASVAMDKCSPSIVREYIYRFSTEQEINNNYLLSYILGCIERQQGDDEKAIRLFDNAFRISNSRITEPIFFDFLKPLLQEINVDSLRSMGVVFKNSKPKKANKYLQKAAFQSRVYSTKLQYATTYSEGYYLMKSFFENNYPDVNHEDAFNAHRAFSESLKQNPEFFPALIRMALLEIGLEQYELAAKRAKYARSVLKKKGLLTDLEYLNYWLNEMILKALQQFNVVNINIPLEDYPAAGVTHCTNAGKKDIICVMRDASFLQKILKHHNLELRHLQQFLNDCKDLIATKE